MRVVAVDEDDAMFIFHKVRGTRPPMRLLVNTYFGDDGDPKPTESGYWASKTFVPMNVRQEKLRTLCAVLAAPD